MNIIPVIRDLLLHNQKAMIPGFGTFIVLQRPAQLNKVTRVLTPPTKVIRFDRNQQDDDGQLSGYLIHKLKQDKDNALSAIDEFVKDSQDQLKNKGALLLEGIGTLSRIKAGEISFSPDEDLQKRISLFELPKLNIPSPQPEAPVAVKASGEVQSVTVRKKKRWWIPAAILTLLVGLSAAVYYTGNSDELISDIKKLIGLESKNDSDKLVFGNPAEQVTGRTGMDSLQEQISRELDKQVDRGKALAIEAEKPATVAVKPAIPSETAQPSSTVTGKSYHIIAGAFLVSNNAERQKEVLEKKGFASEILPKWGNYYMVTLGSYDTHEQAISEMRKISAKLEKELWVMKR